MNNSKIETDGLVLTLRILDGLIFENIVEN